jgi:antitoxin (DNA-binding transcriptional repressor) of toxin-antitoxin stability system
MVVMRSVGLKELKNKLSEYLRLAAAGETVLVTNRDRVVAEIGPPSPTRSPALSDALWSDPCRQGWIAPPILIGREAPALKPIVTIDELLSNLAARQSGPVIHLDSSVALTKISVRRASTN